MVSGIAAGLHVIAGVPEEYCGDTGHGTGDGSAAAAARAGVRVRPVSELTGATRPAGRELVLGYGHLTASGIERGVAALASAIRPGIPGGRSARGWPGRTPG